LAAYETLDAWLEAQQSVHPKTIDLGLARITKVARVLGVDKARYPIITVGGTNGKGSVVAHSDALLRAAGLRTGVFTSPHLVRYNERICVDGAEVSDAELVSAFDRIEAARGDTTLTYFEFNALAALLLFADHEVGVAVLEVGLGGRLDAVNMLDADVAVVASIGFDHKDWLGDTLDAIGREKAGIFRAGRPAVLGTPEMPSSIFETIQSLGAKPVVAERDFRWALHATGFNYRGPTVSLDDLPPSALRGAIQFRNASTAIAAVEALGFGSHLTRDVVTKALRTVRLPGRFHTVPGEVEWILDVAHNEPAARVFADHLAAQRVQGRTIAVVGILGDKDSAAISRLLKPWVDHWILCTIHEPRGLPAEDLAKRMNLSGTAPNDAPGVAPVQLVASAEEGFAAAKALAAPGDRVIVCGGFNIVGAAMRWLNVP
jgi:dihydrofolate synthase/folylpolyglutamate synthase